MQSYSLTIDKFLTHASKWFPDQQIVGAIEDDKTVSNYQQLYARSNLLSGALAAFGLSQGDRVATLAWNTQHHLEMYYAAMGIGLICHTLNPRFSVDNLVLIINEAEDKVLAISSDLVDLMESLVERCHSLALIIVLDDQKQLNRESINGIPLRRVDTFTEQLGQNICWGQFDENTPAGLCYTSGTTGKPKGVLYTHRSNYLHTLRSLQANAMAITAEDSVLVAVPMFHANGWGLPFATAAVGAKLVLPGRNTDGESLAKLINSEQVTLAVGVQTIWLGLLEYLSESGGSLPSLKRILIGGSKCPEALIQRLEEGLGVVVQTSWGMTELSPLGTISAPSGLKGNSSHSGKPLLGLDLLLTDSEGNELSEQRGQVGHLKVKGHSVVEHYYLSSDEETDENGYFETGDLALIDEDGHLTICGRTKDLIKSGGEWINPVDIEEIIGRQDNVSQVAVIGVPHPKWGERPLLIIESDNSELFDVKSIQALLEGKIPKWWIPSELKLVDKMPLAATGKIDKVRLRSMYS